MVMPVLTDGRLAASGPATEEGRRPTIVAGPDAASPELLTLPRRRTFKARDKLRILVEVDAARGTPGGVGAVMRREGLYSSALSDWRRQRDAGAFEALSPVVRGPKVAPANPLAAEHARLLRDNKRLTQRLERAEAIIDLQKNEPDFGPPVAVETIGAMMERRGAAVYFLVELTRKKTWPMGCSGLANGDAFWRSRLGN